MNNSKLKAYAKVYSRLAFVAVTGFGITVWTGMIGFAKEFYHYWTTDYINAMKFEWDEFKKELNKLKD